NPIHISTLSCAHSITERSPFHAWRRVSQLRIMSSPQLLPELLLSLSHELNTGSLECLVCLGPVVDAKSLGKGSVKPTLKPIWHCSTCYNILHFACIKKWATESGLFNEAESDRQFRCPACQVSATIPIEDVTGRCFCGQTPNPTFDPSTVPFTCTKTCGKTHRPPIPPSGIAVTFSSNQCVHTCSHPCHPGPCPPCVITLKRRCWCGKLEYGARCGTWDSGTSCGSVCGKKLNCGLHYCESTCHEGKCEDCSVVTNQQCFGSHTIEALVCGAGTLVSEEGLWDSDRNVREEVYSFACGEPCGRKLDCGDHKCELPCHKRHVEGSSESGCPPCAKGLRKGTCGCGKMTLSQLGISRSTNCTAATPSCARPCQKSLGCAGAHTCEINCHDGICPPCPGTVIVVCACGTESSLVPCRAISSPSFNSLVSCHRVCDTLLSCGKHRCSTRCCPKKGVEGDGHQCLHPCGRQLACGLHRCQRLCHRGPCGSCMEVDWGERICSCGRVRVFPPIPCNTPEPVCSTFCRRSRDCGHMDGHRCHHGPCPPCSFRVSTRCYTGHVTTTVACNVSISGYSCGRLCGLPTEGACLRHGCRRLCHPRSEPCTADVCNARCGQPIQGCVRGHLCDMSCGHQTSCGAGTRNSSGGSQEVPLEEPSLSCPHLVRVSCNCGDLSNRTMKCGEIESRGFVIKSSQTSSLTVECSSATAEGCQIQRRLKIVRNAFSAEPTSTSPSTPAMFRGVSGVVFLDIPPHINRRELSDFIRRCAHPLRPDFSFVNFRDTPSDPKKTQLVNHKIIFANPPVDASFAARIFGNSARQGVVELLYVKGSGPVVQQSPSVAERPSVSDNSTPQSDVRVAGKGKEVVPTTPANVFELLPGNETKDESEQYPAPSPFSVVFGSDTNRPPSKSAVPKQKTPKEAELDELVAAINSAESPTPIGQLASSTSSKPSGAPKCAVISCREKPSLIGRCTFCEKTYCASHRLAEAHSPDVCARKTRLASQTQHKLQATWAIEKERRSPGSASAPGASLQKDRDSARQRLREKMGEMESERGKKDAGKKKKGK
ncbi:hypothetical protein M427DRAFT_405279, partial [Gonapodya prolifera JEL478]